MIDLRYFSIENNQISGDIPDLLVSWKDLEFFNARKNRLSGSIPSYIGDLHKLQEVDLSSNLITGKIPATMGGLKDLRTLRVENNQMAGTFVDDLDSCRSREEASCHLTWACASRVQAPFRNSSASLPKRMTCLS